MRDGTPLPQVLTFSRPVRLAVQAVALVLAVAVITGTLLQGTASAATHASSESSFVTKMNAERTSAGLGRLTIDTQLTRVARAWTDAMAERDVLQHNPLLGTQVRGDWRRVGENVGYTFSSETSEAILIARLHRAFMASPGHRSNILGAYNQVGVGVTVAAGGKTWVTVVFAQASLPTTRRQVSQAVMTSRGAFPTAGTKSGSAMHVMLAAAPAWSTTLQSLSLRGGGPMLVTPAPSRIDPAPVLHPTARAEIDRVLAPGSTVYVVGDESQVSTRAARELTRDGYRVQRLRSAADLTAATPTDVIARLAQILVTP